MDDKYQRLWILFRELIARKSMQEGKFVDQKDLLLRLLVDMAILEAEAVLEN